MEESASCPCCFILKAQYHNGLDYKQDMQTIILHMSLSDTVLIFVCSSFVTKNSFT